MALKFQYSFRGRIPLSAGYHYIIDFLIELCLHIYSVLIILILCRYSGSMIGINEKKNQHISMSMPNKDQLKLQTPTPSISNDDARAPPHKNTVQVGATVDTSKKPVAALEQERLDQERLQKFENEYDRQIRHPFPRIGNLSDTEFNRHRMLKEVFELV